MKLETLYKIVLILLLIYIACSVYFHESNVRASQNRLIELKEQEVGLLWEILDLQKKPITIECE